jgi:hypothetical protein
MGLHARRRGAEQWLQGKIVPRMDIGNPSLESAALGHLRRPVPFSVDR